MKIIDPKVIHQGIDTLVTSHVILNLEDYVSKFIPLLNELESLKDEAQLKESFNQKDRAVKFNLVGYGDFNIYAQGRGRYKYILSNEDIEISIANIEHGTNDFNTPQIRVEYRAHFLFALGNKKAYEIVLKLIKKLTGATKNLCQRIDIATDIQGIQYTSSDKTRFQTLYKSADFSQFNEWYRHHRTTGFHIGNPDCLFRIYDKTLETRVNPNKRFIEYKWIANGYDKDKALPVWRHEVQYRRAELKKFMPKYLEDEVIFHFTQIDKLWNNIITKVRWTDLTREEIQRIEEKNLKSDSIKKIFQRARTNPARIDFWNILKNWDNELSNIPIKYEDIKEGKKETAKKYVKALVGSTYKALGSNPQMLIDILNEVQSELLQNNLTLHQYGELKTLSNFIQNAKIIDRLDLNPTNDYTALALDTYHNLKSTLSNIDKIPEMKQAQNHFDNKGVSYAS